MSCELGLIETTEPTGGTQKGEYLGGPTNGQAAACRRRLAAKGAIHTLNGGGQPSSSALFLPFFLLISCHLRPTGLSAPIISSPSSIPVHLLHCTTIILPPPPLPPISCHLPGPPPPPPPPAAAPTSAPGVEVDPLPTLIPSSSFCQKPPPPQTSCCPPGPPPPAPPATPPPSVRRGSKPGGSPQPALARSG